MGLFDKLKFLVEAPMNNDVTTTPDDPPEFRACAELPANEDRNMRFRGRNILLDDEPLEPLESDLEPGELFERALELVEQQENWRLVAADPDEGRMEAVAITPTLKFKDDVVIELRGSDVHMRSKSRLGRKDFGANEERIRSFLEELSTTVR